MEIHLELMKIKDLPSSERPREKAKRFGFDSLSNSELLAIILGGGTKNMNVIQLATNLLSEVGGISGLTNYDYHHLKKLYGIKEAKALMLSGIIELYKRIDIDKSVPKEKRYIEELLIDYQSRISSFQEQLILVVVNSAYQVIKEKLLYIGTKTNLLISTRDIFREVYNVDARYFYLVHTHPSGIAEASELDILTTKELAKKAKKAGLKLLNHYIVSDNSFIGLLDDGVN